MTQYYTQFICESSKLMPTGAEIVVSSTWREFSDIEQILKEAGVVAPIIGKTPVIRTLTDGDITLAVPRGREIAAWLRDSAPVVDSMVILDDDSDMEDLSCRLIQTNFEHELTMEHAERAISMLKESQ